MFYSRQKTRSLVKNIITIFAIVSSVSIQISLSTTCVYASNNEALKTRCIEILKQGLSANEDTIRNDSVSYMGELSIVNSDIKTRMLEMLSNDKSEYVRAAVVYYLMKLKERSYTSVFRNALKDQSPQAHLIHIAAAVALHNLGEKGFLKIIEKYLDSKKRVESIEAAIGAGLIMDGASISLLKDRLRTNNKFLKIALLDSLARLGDKIPESEINLLLDGDAELEGLRLVKILKDGRFETKIEKKLASKNPLIRITSAEVLSIISGKQTKPIITEYLLSDKEEFAGIPGEDVRLFAVDALSAMGDTSDLPLLTKFLSRKGRERIAAAASILKILNRIDKGK